MSGLVGSIYIVIVMIAIMCAFGGFLAYLASIFVREMK